MALGAWTVLRGTRLALAHTAMATFVSWALQRVSVACNVRVYLFGALFIPTRLKTNATCTYEVLISSLCAVGSNFFDVSTFLSLFPLPRRSMYHVYHVWCVYFRE